jgi:membrane-associated phospholipid phosphatase
VRPLPLVLTGASAAAPLAMAPTGADYDIRVWAQRDLGGKYHLEPVSFFTPFVLAGGTLVAHVAGAALGSCSVQRPTAAMLQALALGMALTGALKVTTGRAWPNGGRDPTLPDRLDHPEDARDFRPFRRGLAAFPSGHTLSVTTLAAAFRAAEPELGVLSWVLYPVVLGVGAGMWFSDHHWASDVLSGALLGEAIGNSVGRAFLRASDHKEGPTPSGEPFVEPIPGGGALVGFRIAL